MTPSGSKSPAPQQPQQQDCSAAARIAQQNIAIIISYRLAPIPAFPVSVQAVAAAQQGGPSSQAAGSFWKLATLANHVPVKHTQATSFASDPTQVIRYRVIALSRYRRKQPQQHGNRMWGSCQILIR